MELLEAALSRSDTPCGLTDEDGRTQDMIGNGEIYRLVENPSAYFIEYNDGFKGNASDAQRSSARLLLRCTTEGKEPVPVSTQFFLTPTPNVTYSACLIAKIEELFETGIAPYPAERTLLVSGALESCLTSRLQGHVRLETPHLNVEYRAPAESQHARQ